MASTPFSLSDGGVQINSYILDADGSGLYNGFLVEIGNAGEVVLANDPESVLGMLYDRKEFLLPHQLVVETDANLLDTLIGESIGVIVSDCVVSVGSAHWESTTGAVKGARVSASTSAPGKYKVAASTDLVLGQISEVVTDQYGTSVYIVRFSFPASQVVA